MRRRTIDPRNATVLEVAYARTGSMLKAARVIAFIAAWGQTTRELGREPTPEEYAEHWGESRATAYRHLALFRETFDRCETPAPVVQLLDAHRAGQRADLSDVVIA